jgi:murein endopeptidase
MSENCARPGCGHDSEDHAGATGCQWWPFGRSPNGCSCRAYRTQAQQEAWEDAKASGFQSWRKPDLVRVIERLLELYP